MSVRQQGANIFQSLKNLGRASLLNEYKSATEGVLSFCHDLTIDSRIWTAIRTVLTYTSDRGPLNLVGDTPKMYFSCATTACPAAAVVYARTSGSDKYVPTKPNFTKPSTTYASNHLLQSCQRHLSTYSVIEMWDTMFRPE